MFRVFEASTADGLWQQVAETFRRQDGTKQQPSRIGRTREILHAAISISDPRQRWVVSRLPAMNPAFAIAEVVWIMTGRNDSEFLNFFNRRLPSFAGDAATYYGAYGHRLRNHFAVDQLDRAYHALKTNGHSRQVVLQVWDGRIDLPDFDGREAAPDVPCNVLSMLKVRDGRLDWTQVVRSNDVFRGLPYNLVQFTSIQEIMAGWLNVELGSYNQISDSLHVYDDCSEYIEAAEPTDNVPNRDLLGLPKSESESAFLELAQHVDEIRKNRSQGDTLLDRVHDCRLPSAFKNMLCVLAAEAARRCRRRELADQIMECCSNGAFRQLFDRWSLRLAVANA